MVAVEDKDILPNDRRTGARHIFMGHTNASRRSQLVALGLQDAVSEPCMAMNVRSKCDQISRDGQ
jgi:hypothetical protein